MRGGLLSTAIVCAALGTTLAAAKIKVRTDYDKTFDFARVHTYLWHPSGAGDVKLLQNSGDDPAALRARFEPVIVGAVDQALTARGLTKALAGGPDVHVGYYLLVGPNIEAQTMGQFLRPVPEWGVPPFAPATQSLEIYEQGTLILDISAVDGERMVWRGSAQAEIDREKSAAARDDRIRTAVNDMLKKFPPKK
jgi:Domain of unknown function (DUF4136)